MAEAEDLVLWYNHNLYAQRFDEGEFRLFTASITKAEHQQLLK